MNIAPFFKTSFLCLFEDLSQAFGVAISKVFAEKSGLPERFRFPTAFVWATWISHRLFHFARVPRLGRSGALSFADRMQTLQVSFSVVSKPNFARKYAFDSSRRDLHNALLCTALKSHFFLKSC